MQPNQPRPPAGPALAPAKPDPADRRVEALDLAIKSYTAAPSTADIVTRAEAFAKFITG